VWRWIVSRFRRPRSEIDEPSLTPPEEHEEAERRLSEIEARVKSLEVRRDLIAHRPPPHRPEGGR
jgi:hypothetical protein